MLETNQIPDPCDVRTAAEVLHLSEQSVRSMLRDGRLKGARLGHVWLVSKASVEAIAPVRPSASAPGDKLQVISLFSGAMGLDLGLEAAGMEVRLACESDASARATIAANRPQLPLLGDVWKYSAEEVREQSGLEPGEVDVIAGGPPCQAFSTAGARRGFEDIRGNVFLRYIDILLELRPRYFVIENVRGLLSAPMKHRPHRQRGADYPPLEADEKRGGALAYVLAMLREGGYEVSFNLYNAANYGSAQIRERVVIIGSLSGRVPYLAPTHDQYGRFGLPRWRTVRDAIGDLDGIEHDHVDWAPSRAAYFRKLRDGQNWRHLPVEDQVVAMGRSYHSGGGRTGFYRRLAWDKPSPTLVTSPAMPATDLGHPDKLRPLSVQEYKRLQDFPPDWILRGSIRDQYKQLGNAVPVSLGTAIGRTIVSHAMGESLPPIPSGFNFSRYRNTSDGDWLPTTSSARALV